MRISPGLARRGRHEVLRLGLVWSVFTAVHRLARRSGATDAECHGSLPGDEEIAHPMVEWTRATTVDGRPEQVWPWLVQMGYRRGGWYTNEAFDRVVWRIPNPSADEILPEWQHLQVGDLVPDGPDFAAYFHVKRLDPDRCVVYRSLRHPFRGHPVDPGDPAAIERLERRLVDQGCYLDFSWAFVLQATSDGRTRLLVRTRADYAPWSLRFSTTALGLVDLFHVSTMFRGLRRRVGSMPTSWL